MVFVHRDRSHPAVCAVRVIGPCLENGRSGSGAARVSELIPPNRSMVGFAVSALDRDITNERFLHGIAAKITIGQPVHQEEVEVINVVTRERRCRLRDAIAMIPRVGVVDTRRDTPSLLDETFG